MTITSDHMYSWPVALWLLVGIALSVVTWRLTGRVKVVWQRAFLRACVIALCFTPTPSPGVFALTDPIGIIPVWSVLFWAVTSGTLVALGIAFIEWLVATYLLWVAGMSVQRVFRRFNVR